MADNRRTPIPTRVKQDLREYFRDTRCLTGAVRCVVTEGEQYTWHHLNHKPNDHRLSNIVPLIQDLNKNLDIARNHDNYLDSCLDCEALKSRAEHAFWLDGQAANAYGCTRIEYYVAQYCNRPFSYRLDCACRALYYARHRLNYDIIEQLIGDTILEPLNQSGSKVCPAVIRRLLQEFETLLSLGGETAEELRLR